MASEAELRAQYAQQIRNQLYAQRDLVAQSLARGENPYGGRENAINSIFKTYGANGNTVSYQEAAGIIGQAYDQAGAGGAGDTAYSGGAGAGASGPAMVRGSLQDKIDALNNLYNIITNDVNALTTDRRNQLETGYGEQNTELTKQYEKSAGVLPNAFSARGIRDSSYYENAATDAADTYTKSQKQLQSDKEQKLADLGRTAAGQLAGIQAGRGAIAAYNPSFYGTEADLNAARSSFDSQIGSLTQQHAGLGTDAGYRGQLNSIAPVKSTGAADLQAQLQKITQSSIPGFAKETIAKGLIKQSGQDPAYWEDYYAKQAGGQATPLT